MYLLAVTKYERILLNSVKNILLEENKELNKITDGEAIVRILEDFKFRSGIYGKSKRKRRAKNN